MPTTFQVFSLGVQADLDTTEGNIEAENADALIGLVIGSAVAPLYDQIQTLSPGTAGFSGGANSFAYDSDNLASNDEFRINGGADQIYDSAVEYFVRLTYADGTTANISAVIFQDTLGNTYLAPDVFAGSAQSALEAKAIVSIRPLFNIDDTRDMTADRIAGTYQTPDGTVDGTAGDDIINVGFVDAQGDAVDNGGNVIVAGDGADLITAGAGNDTVFAGAGNDTVAASSGTDTIFGGGGNDTISHEFGTATVAGGEGDDFIVNTTGTAASTPTTIDGGAGVDTYALDGSLGAFLENHVIDLSIGEVTFSGNTRDLLSGIENASVIEASSGVIGDGNANVITATGNFNNSLSGGGGNDTIFAGAGQDTIDDGSGNDTVFGGVGSDRYFTSVGNDTFFGGGGADRVLLTNGFGFDAYFGGNDGSNDSIDALALLSPASIVFTNATGGTIAVNGVAATFDGFGVFEAAFGEGGTLDATLSGDGILYYDNGGPTTATGSAFDDQILAFGADPLGINNRSYFGGAGNDSLDSANGNDTLDGGTGDDTIVARGGNDTIAGGDGNDEIYAGDGNDSIAGGAGNDTLFGDGGDDTIYSGAGNDTIIGGAGTEDFLVYGGSFQDYTYAVDGAGNLLITQTATGDIDTISDVERIQFSEGTFDLVVGTNANDGLGPPDTDPVFIVSGNGTDGAVGSANADVYYGGDGADNLNMGDGNDTIFGGGGNDGMDGAGGDDLIFGGAGDDGSDGGAGNDTLYGDAGNDTIGAGDGNDTLFGGIGNDTLFGGDGGDTLSGQAGDDTLTLGAGDDTAAFLRFGGADVITDFDIVDTDANGFTNDQLDVSALRDLSGNPVNVDDVIVVDDGGFARLNFPEGESILLQGVPVASMSSRAQLVSAGIPCFTAGTLILTARGEIPVEALSPGDRVITRDNGIQPIVWIGRRRLGRKELLSMPKLRPIQIAAGVYGNARAVMFSPQHGVLLCDKSGGAGEHFVRARHLARLKGGKVRVANGVNEVTYVHMMFEAHQVVMSDGLWSESFYPGPQAIASLRQAEIDELTALFPDLLQTDSTFAYGQSARQFAAFRDLAHHISAHNPAAA